MQYNKIFFPEKQVIYFLNIQIRQNKPFYTKIREEFLENYFYFGNNDSIFAYGNVYKKIATFLPSKD